MVTLVIPTTKLFTTLQSVVHGDTGYPYQPTLLSLWRIKYWVIPTTELHKMLHSLAHDDTGYPYHQTTHNATECVVHDTGYPHHQITKLRSLWCIITRYPHHQATHTATESVVHDDTG